jgi:peptidoglycan LD-endopeptidase LytH
MTRTHRRFPAAFRLLAIACALGGLAWLTPVATAQQSPPTQDQVDQLQADADALADEVKDLNGQLAEIEARLNEAVGRVEGQEGLIEQTTAKLLDVRSRIDDNQARYDRIVHRLNDRAVEAYIQGPGSSVEFLLGATSLSDLSDRIEFVGAVAQSDTDLASEVEGLRQLLLIDRANLEELQSTQRDQLAETEALRDRILGDYDRAQALRDEIQSKYAEAEALFKKKKAAYQEWVKEQQRLATLSPPHDPVPLPAGYADVLQVCPVGQPRYYGDGFGAPRYAGGYHLHAGVDLLAPTGTEIYAPFDGTARSDYNSLGGNSVFVYGKYGYVYNAHLSAFTALSNGPVHAGDVIGLVGDTGDAIGTPHLHFEFHPNVIPASWPASSYGYSVVGTAVNPYPLLVAACG